MTLTQLRYLVAIADAGLNITLAAARVHATQPGLSKQLKQLEDELGFLMFVRKGRSLETITPAGAEVLARARVILAETANIRSYAANERGEHRGRLLLATTHTQARYVLPPAIAQLKQRYPQVSVDLFASGDSEVLDKLDEADFALIEAWLAVPEMIDAALAAIGEEGTSGLPARAEELEPGLVARTAPGFESFAAFVAAAA